MSLRERDLGWIIIPTSGEAAAVTHELSISRIFARAGTVEGGELKDRGSGLRCT